MNAVIREPDSSNDFYVALSEVVRMEEGFGELRADVRHIRSEATDIKADVRATNVRLDELHKDMNTNEQVLRTEFGKKLDDVGNDMKDGRKETGTRFDKLTDNVDDVKDRVEKGQSQTADKFERIQVRMDAGQKELAEKIDSLKESLGQAKVWALGLYIGLAGALLLVIAHGFKWL